MVSTTVVVAVSTNVVVVSATVVVVSATVVVVVVGTGTSTGTSTVTSGTSSSTDTCRSSAATRDESVIATVADPTTIPDLPASPSRYSNTSGIARSANISSREAATTPEAENPAPCADATAGNSPAATTPTTTTTSSRQPRHRDIPTPDQNGVTTHGTPLRLPPILQPTLLPFPGAKVTIAWSAAAPPQEEPRAYRSPLINGCANAFGCRICLVIATITTMVST